MGDDAVFLVQIAFQLADNPVGVNRLLVGVENLGPIGHPLVIEFGDLGGDVGLASAAVLSYLTFHFLNHCLEGQLRVAGEANVHRKIFVQVFAALRVMNDDLAVGYRLAIARPGHAGANREQHVRLLKPGACR